MKRKKKSLISVAKLRKFPIFVHLTCPFNANSLSNSQWMMIRKIKKNGYYLHVPPNFHKK